MQVNVERKTLLNVMSKVKLAVTSRSALPILSCFKLEAGQGHLTITGGNLEHFLIGSCEGKVLKVGAVCVEAKPLEAFLKASSADEVRLVGTVENKKEEPRTEYQRNPETGEYQSVNVEHTRKVISFKVEAGAATATIEAKDAADYPLIAQVKGKPLTITAFDQVIARVGYAIAAEDTRPVLNGLNLRQQGRKIQAAAANGFQLAIAPVEAVGKLKDELIIPLKSVLLIKRLFKDFTLRYNKGENVTDCLIEGEGLTMVIRLTSGTFPNYPQLVPKGGVSLTADTAEFKEAVKLISASPPGNGKVLLQTLKRKLVVSAHDEDNITEVKIKAKGKIKIAFNLNYLKELLSQAGETITLRTTTPSSPALMKTANSTHVVMPMFVQNWSS